MAKDQGPDDIDRLLAEVDQSLSGRAPARRPTPAGSTSAAPAVRSGSALSRMALPAGVAAIAVGLLFFFLPIVGAISGAAGAFLGALLALLWARLRG